MTIDEQNPTKKLAGGMRRLILMRHAKSDWGDDSLSDHDRPLNQRGRSSAPAMAAWLAGVNALPDLVLSSSSQRTRETMDLMSTVWDPAPEVKYTDTLYLAPADSILEVIFRDASDVSAILVLAHNPGMAHLVSCLADKFIDMPTAAAAVFDIEIENWQVRFSPDDVTLVDFMRPKALG